MAPSAFKSTTHRPSLGGSASDLSTPRFSPDNDAGYSGNVPRGKFVNTTRGSGAPPLFPEISLDDLALEFFSSSSTNDNESDGVPERNGSSGRSASRLGRWAADTASSRRRARSVSRTRGGAVSSSSTSGCNMGISNEAAGSRRRRSLSVARYQISDTESEVDSFRNSNSNKHATASWNSQNATGQKTTSLTNRRLGRSRSHKFLLHDGFSSPASALTDDDSKDSHYGKIGFEKIIREVYADKKSEYPSADVANGGFYEAMRKEIRCAVEEFRSELNQTMRGNQTAVANQDDFLSENSKTLQDSSGIEVEYFEKSVKCEQDILTEPLFREEQGQVVFKVFGEHPDARTSATADEPSRARKRSSDSSRISENLIDKADRILKDFICNVEDADISSFDGERSDRSSTLGGTLKTRGSATMEAEPYKTPVEMDGVILPWLQWETSHDGFLSRKSKAHTPVTPKPIHWDSEKDMVPCDDQGRYSISSHGSWSPGIFSSPQDSKNITLSRIDMAEYKRLQINEDVLFEMYRQQNRIHSGGILLCTHTLY